MDEKILTINSGSSSIKFSVYSGGRPVLSGSLERIGLPNGVFSARGADMPPAVMAASFKDHPAALSMLIEWLGKVPGLAIAAVGHRVVHGGPLHSSPELIDAGLLEELKRLSPFAAEHLPHEIAAIEALTALMPGVPQAACFDTAFHRTMPERARALPLPWDIRAEGVERYGFHGLSYDYITEELSRIDPARAQGRTIIAHLGNGASMCAVRRGRSVDTTMGFTPLGGLVMSTRSGELDPGVVVWLLKKRGYGADGLNELLNRRSGLLALSGASPDMAELLKAEASSPGAALAIDVFCYQARKCAGALAAALGGLDTFVFTAGIGENSPEIRERILAGLEFLGLSLDKKANLRSDAVISAGPVTVRVMKTNEELMIARQTRRLMGGK